MIMQIYFQCDVFSVGILFLMDQNQKYRYVCGLLDKQRGKRSSIERIHNGPIGILLGEKHAHNGGFIQCGFLCSKSPDIHITHRNTFDQ